MITKISNSVLRILLISLSVSGICGCDNEVGVEWVNDYKKVGKPSLSCRKPCAEGFYQTIYTLDGWVGRFNEGDANAWEKHFKRTSKGGIDDQWIDGVDFVYFAGHGAGDGSMKTNVGLGGGFTFGVNANDDWVLASTVNKEPRWGDGDLEWIVLDVCSALALQSDGAGYPLSTRWANSDVMHGLHYILGFRTSAHDNGSCNRGKIFAEYITGARDGTKYTVREAWMKATKDTEGFLNSYTSSPVQGAYLRASSPGANTYDDHIHGTGWVSSTPDPTSQKYYNVSWPCD